MPSTPHPATPRFMQFALFGTGLLWMFAARALADRISQLVANSINQPLVAAPLREALLVTLLAVGFALLHWTGARRWSLREANALPSRITSAQEFARGGALGWALALLTLLPLVLLGDVSPAFFFSPALLGRTLLSLCTIALAALAAELAFRGFLYQRLIAAVGTVGATFLLALLYAFVAVTPQGSPALAFVVAFFFGVLYAIAWQRTHALWLGWGIHVAWMAVLALVFGVPVAGNGAYASLVQSSTYGLRALTGGDYGPQASLFALALVLLAIPVLYAITRGYAWDYTHPEILAAGYPMDIPPPAAHTAMEQQAAAQPTLVQIAAITPAAPSTLPEASDALRRSRETSTPS